MSEPQPLANGGLYEVFVGTEDAARAIAWWQAFGYRVADDVALDAGLAERLYGHRSAARSVRLQGPADHGLVRLLQWETPANAGLGMRGLRYAGNRWVGHFARSVMTIANHADAARKNGMALEAGDIHFIDMGKAYAHLFGGTAPTPFADELIALREMSLFTPETRQVFLERFGYDSPLLGTFADDSLMRTTQVVQGCMLIESDDPDVVQFYPRVLDLKQSLDLEVPWEDAQASRAVFGLTEGETHWNFDLDEPRSGSSVAERRSGRIKGFRFSPKWPTESVHELASPGALGLSNYTWRVHDIAEAAARLQANGAQAITDIVDDEFGARALSFRAPDGYFWTFIEG